MARWEARRPTIDPETGEVLREGRKRARKPDDVKALRGSLSATLANLLAQAFHKTHPKRFVAVGYGNGDYIQVTCGLARYRQWGITRTGMATARDYLVDRSYVDFAPGVHGHDFGWRSRMRATDRLLGLLLEFGVGLDHIRPCEGRETIILKGHAPARNKPKPLVGYNETGDTRQWRATLAAVNDLLGQTAIAYEAGFNFAPDPEGQPDDAPEMEAPRALAGDLSAKTLVRIFNDERWDHGGRLYGGHWERAPKGWRKHILINGEPTLELDFKGLHARLLYIRAGLVPPEDDPYHVEVAGRVAPRDRVKVLFNRLINSASGHGPLKRQTGDMGLFSAAEFRAVQATLRAKHEAIAHYFGTGVGVKLQRVDGDIAMTVLETLSVARGIPVLPVHDSYIVQRRNRRALRDAMEDAFRGRVGVMFDPMIVEVDKGGHP